MRAVSPLTLMTCAVKLLFNVYYRLVLLKQKPPMKYFGVTVTFEEFKTRFTIIL